MKSHLLSRRKHNIQKKFMLTIFWNINGFPIVEILPDGEKFTDEYFVNNILKSLNQIAPQNRNRKLVLHYDNARPHTSRKVNRYLDENRMKRAPQPPYSPDIAPSNFFLFGYIKSKLNGQHFDSVESLLEEVQEILSEISKETLKKVFEDCERRLNEVINRNGEFIE